MADAPHIVEAARRLDRHLLLVCGWSDSKITHHLAIVRDPSLSSLGIVRALDKDGFIHDPANTDGRLAAVASDAQ